MVISIMWFKYFYFIWITRYRDSKCCFLWIYAVVSSMLSEKNKSCFRNSICYGLLDGDNLCENGLNFFNQLECDRDRFCFKTFLKIIAKNIKEISKFSCSFQIYCSLKVNFFFVCQHKIRNYAIFRRWKIAAQTKFIRLGLSAINMARALITDMFFYFLIEITLNSLPIPYSYVSFTSGLRKYVKTLGDFFSACPFTWKLIYYYFNPLKTEFFFL